MTSASNSGHDATSTVENPSPGASPGALPEVDVSEARQKPPPSDRERAGRARGRRDGRPTRIIAMMNQKGGVGKTTTCANLGAALARRKRQVLLIDLDPQAHLSLHLGVDPEEVDAPGGSMYDLLTDPNTTAIEVVQRVDANLGVLPAEVNLAGVESELAENLASGAAQSVLRDKCQELASQFDYVLIDCPPSLGLLTINALTMAREVIVPMQAHFLALQGLSKLLETVNMVRQRINAALTVSGVVVCMHESQTILAGEVLSDLNGFLDAARGTEVPWRDAVVFKPPIRRNIKLAECPSFGQSIFKYAPDCRGAQDYTKLAKSVAARRPAKA